MNLRVMACLAAIMLTLSSQAQTSAKPAQSVYVELGGPGVASVNFDSRFNKKEAGLGGRIGIGGLSIDGSSTVYIPIGLNYIIGKDNKNYFEMCAGVTPVFTNEEDPDELFTETFGHLIFGYRKQPQNGGFIFRAFMCPVFGSGSFVPFYAGVSFGYKF